MFDFLYPKHLVVVSAKLTDGTNYSDTFTFKTNQVKTYDGLIEYLKHEIELKTNKKVITVITHII